MSYNWVIKSSKHNKYTILLYSHNNKKKCIIWSVALKSYNEAIDLINIIRAGQYTIIQDTPNIEYNGQCRYFKVMGVNGKTLFMSKIYKSVKGNRNAHNQVKISLCKGIKAIERYKWGKIIQL
jgi:hypothetical protein